jgi:hypothetical protein
MSEEGGTTELAELAELAETNSIPFTLLTLC